MPRTRPSYPPEFRQQMVELMKAGRAWVQGPISSGFLCSIRLRGLSCRRPPSGPVRPSWRP